MSQIVIKKRKKHYKMGTIEEYFERWTTHCHWTHWWKCGRLAILVKRNFYNGFGFGFVHNVTKPHT